MQGITLCKHISACLLACPPPHTHRSPPPPSCPSGWVTRHDWCAPSSRWRRSCRCGPSFTWPFLKLGFLSCCCCTGCCLEHARLVHRHLSWQGLWQLAGAMPVRWFHSQCMACELPFPPTAASCSWHPAAYPARLGPLMHITLRHTNRVPLAC